MANRFIVSRPFSILGSAPFEVDADHWHARNSGDLVFHNAEQGEIARVAAGHWIAVNVDRPEPVTNTMAPQPGVDQLDELRTLLEELAATNPYATTYLRWLKSETDKSYAIHRIYEDVQVKWRILAPYLDLFRR